MDFSAHSPSVSGGCCGVSLFARGDTIRCRNLHKNHNHRKFRMSYLTSDPNHQQSDLKRHIIFMAVLLIGVFLWMQYSAKNAAQQQHVEQTQAAVDSSVTAQTVAQADPTINLNIDTQPQATRVEQLPLVGLTNHKANYRIDPNTGSIRAAELLNFFHVDTETPVTLFEGLANFDALSPEIDPTHILTGVALAETNDSTIVITRTYRKPNPGGQDATYRIDQTLEILGGYQLASTFKVTNTSPFPFIVPTFSVSTGGIQPELQLSGDHIYTAVHSVAGATPGNDIHTVNAHPTDADFLTAFAGKSFRWIMTQNKYCTSIMRSAGEPFSSAEPQRAHYKDTASNTDYIAVGVKGVWSQLPVLETGKSFERGIVLYTGPKYLSAIGEFDATAISALQLSYFSWFESLARWTMKLLFLIHDHLCANYGIAIIIITLVLRVIFWPIQNRSQESMMKMQAVQPKMKELQAKYKDNPQVMNAKIMELYREEGVNPMSGCLPMLIQLPVFIALFAALNGAVELRGVPFLWIESLTRPDTIAHIFSLPINPLILAQTALMVLQQRLTPSSGDATQKRMMYLMPVMILIFFYNMPAGLTLYMTVSSIPQVIQQWYKLKKNKAKTA